MDIFPNHSSRCGSPESEFVFGGHTNQGVPLVYLSWGAGCDRESIGKARDDGGADDSQCLAWSCKRALEGFEFLFKIISHASVLVFPAKVHGT